MGVRISWLMLARNCDLARLAASAASFARLSSSSASLRAVTLALMPAMRTATPAGSRSTTLPRAWIQHHCPESVRTRYSPE